MAKVKLTQEEIEKEIWKTSQDLGETKNSKHWLSRAKSFHFTTKFIIKDYLETLGKTNETIPKDKEYMFGIFVPFLYLLATTVELYLKTYLIAKGRQVKDVVAYQHNLKKLRLECLSYGDNRFDKSSLPYITDSYGRVLLESGGLRYPGRKPPPAIFPDYVDVLDHLRKIIDEEIEQKRETS